MPKTRGDDTTQSAPVHKLQALIDAGEPDQAWEAAQAHLDEHPDDLPVRLLKAELCLDLEREPDFVGQMLTELRSQGGESSRLLQRAERLASSTLTVGRNRLSRGNVREALGHFHTACSLLPFDPSVTLSAALALLADHQGSPDAFESLDSLLSDGDNRQGLPSEQREGAEKFLSQTLERSAPGQLARTEARRQLIHLWLHCGQVDKAIAWLEDSSDASDVTHGLKADIHHHTLAAALDVAASLLRTGALAAARKIIRLCVRAVPEASTAHILNAEALRLSGETQPAIRAYQRALKQMDKPATVADEPAVRYAWKAAQSYQVGCPRCGKTMTASTRTCAFCAESLCRNELMLDRYRVAGISDALIAHAALADLLADAGQSKEALHHLDAAIHLLAQQHGDDPLAKTLREKQISLESQTVQSNHVVWHIAESLRSEKITSEIAQQVHQVCATEPSQWQELPLQARLNLARTLLEGEYLDVTRAFLAAAFLDMPNRKSVQKLSASLDQAVQTKLDALLKTTQEALDAGRYEEALQLASDALALRPDQEHARLLRSQSRLGIGHDLAALADIHRVVATSSQPALIRAARLAGARALEKRGDLEQALALLDDLEGEEIERIRQRLNRHRRGEPVVLVSPASDAVMYDTLARAPMQPHVQGYSAIALRSVGRPWNMTLREWMETTLKATFEFVQVLGGLRHILSTPLFALRLISQPDAHIPERGQLQLALIVRVSAEGENVCQQCALDLWQTVKALLPAQQTYVYTFEPVVDADELAYLLAPFEVDSIAEIVRREEIAGAAHEPYTTYPFAPGTLDLHNLCWTLLRQPAPAMVSVHLLPTALMAWERTALDRLMVDEPPPAMRELDDLRLADPVSQWWQGVPRWSQAQASRRLVDSMPSQAYLMSITVATAEHPGSLLPEAVASALFGPANPTADTRYGGYEVVRASSAEEVAIARQNLRSVDLERWVYTVAPARLTRLRYLMNESEAVLAFRLPIPGQQGLPGVPLIDAKPVPPPIGLPLRGLVLGESVTRVAGMPLRITQGAEDRRRHTYVLGKTGVGKSTLLGVMALQDIEAGEGVCVVDPHGDLIEDLLARIPPHRAEDVILFDPSDSARPVGLNLLEAANDVEKAQIVNEFIGLLIRMYDPHQQGIVGPRFQHNVRNAMLTVMALEGSTLIEVVRALTDSAYVRSILPSVTDLLVRNYWEKQIANTSDFHKSEVLDYIVSKFSRFVGDPRVRHIIGQRRTTLNFRQVMDRRQILLVNLSKGKIGPENAQFLGLLLVQRLLLTALSRADVPTSERHDFFLYVDEFQNFATDLFATILSEGRKYGVSVVVANQYLTQLDFGIREAIFGNVGSMVNFRLGVQDASAMAPEMYPSFDADDLINLPRYTTCVKLLVDGLASKPFTMRTLPDLRLPDSVQGEAIRQASRQKYGRDRDEIAADIMTRYKT